jgi:hypothetical protein
MKSLQSILDAFNTTEWATWQDQVFASGTLPPPDEALKWGPLCALQREVNGPTNLTIRQGLILSALGLGPESRAAKDFEALRRNGFWLEGYSYYEYVMRGVEWYERIHGPFIKGFYSFWYNGGMHELRFQEIPRTSYSFLVSPTGEIPLPEVAITAIPACPDDYTTSLSYLVKRWKDSEGKVTGYFILCTDPVLEPRMNFHKWPDMGYFAFWTSENGMVAHTEEWGTEIAPNGDTVRVRKQAAPTVGTWLARCKPYTGFPDHQKVILDGREGEELGLPTGAIPALWRLSPPKTHFERKGDSFFFRWGSGLFAVTRRVDLLPDGVRVTDKSGRFGRKKVREYRAG